MTFCQQHLKKQLFTNNISDKTIAEYSIRCEGKNTDMESLVIQIPEILITDQKNCNVLKPSGNNLWILITYQPKYNELALGLWFRTN